MVFLQLCIPSVFAVAKFLVDDVYTSGATLGELRRVLLRAGAESVCGVAFCRVVRTV